MNNNVMSKFSLTDRVVAVTGGAGFLGEMHCEAIIEAGGIPVILDILDDKIEGVVSRLKKKYDSENILGFRCDITNKESISRTLEKILLQFPSVYALINNAAVDPKVGESGISIKDTRFENLTLDFWQRDLNVGLTGAFLCSQVFGCHMAKIGEGVILNFASDLAVIAPDQRLYKKEAIDDDEQPVKPVTYSVVKTAMLGLTRYLSTYWAEKNIRVNSISPGGVFNNQDKEFLKRVEDRIPLNRMANRDEYKGAVVFLLSDASSYMNGGNLIVDGGRSVW